ncbi:alpha/beta fold hydrolase [Sphingomonas sp. ID1715]|nr:alpha/beta fold hydrolase [Sphingomonas sp. ID1715]
MQPLLDRLGTERPVIALDWLGHGGRPIPERFTVEAIGADLIAQLDARGIAAAHFFGFSVGGLLALWLAARHPERVLSVATLTAKFIYDARAIAHATHLTSAERLLRSNPERAAALERMHAPQDWQALIVKVRDMFAEFAERPPLTREELAGITKPVLALGALEDPLVPAAEVRELAGLVPGAIPALFPGTAHPLAQAPLDTIVRTLTRFIDNPAGLQRTARVKLTEFRWDRR